jgi:hypothetical protein
MAAADTIVIRLTSKRPSRNQTSRALPVPAVNPANTTLPDAFEYAIRIEHVNGHGMPALGARPRMRAEQGHQGRSPRLELKLLAHGGSGRISHAVR